MRRMPSKEGKNICDTRAIDSLAFFIPSFFSFSVGIADGSRFDAMRRQSLALSNARVVNALAPSVHLAGYQ